MDNRSKSKARVYAVALCLCAAFCVNVGLMILAPFLGVARMPMLHALSVLLALAAILLGLAFPRLSSDRLQIWNSRILVVFISLIYLLVSGFLLYSLLRSFTLNMQFRAMVRDADRVVIRDGGNLCCNFNPDIQPVLYESTNKAEIAEFNRLFCFSSQTMHCKCCGYPGVDWWRNGKRIAVSALHHGTALRIEGKSFDWRLSPSSQERIKEWLKTHCGEQSQGGYPMYRRCFENRGYLEMEAWDWPKTNGGRKPDIADLRDSAKKKWSGERDLSCPAGGKYSLSFDENGAPHVSCSIPRHE
jgi:hypothetical protein